MLGVNGPLSFLFVEKGICIIKCNNADHLLTGVTLNPRCSSNFLIYIFREKVFYIKIQELHYAHDGLKIRRLWRSSILAYVDHLASEN